MVSPVTLEVDWNQDGSFGAAIDDISEYLWQIQTFQGRDFASHYTGKSNPGRLRCILNNLDNRFSSFNTSSPLYGLLKPGRKVRLRDPSATALDSTLLARDRFRKADGLLGSEEVGPLAWQVVTGFPYVATTTETPFASSTTSHPVQMPDVVKADDLLVTFTVFDSVTPATPTGWTSKHGAGAPALGIFVKKAAGTEGGTTVDFVTGSAQNGGALVYRILAKSWSGDLADVQVGTAATGTSTAPNPPSVTASWGAATNLFLACYAADGTGAVSDIPANFDGLIEHVAPSHVLVVTQSRQQLATVDPAAFTKAGSTDWRAQTVVIRPLGSAGIQVINEEAVVSEDLYAKFAIVNVGVQDYYLQCRVPEIGDSWTNVGLVYRYIDGNAYSTLVVDNNTGQLRLIDWATGVPTQVAAYTTPLYGGMTIGVLVNGADVTIYLEGIPVSGPHVAANDVATADFVGIWTQMASGSSRFPTITDFYAWDALPQEVTGILWTGYIDRIQPFSLPGNRRAVQLSALGPLSKAAAVERFQAPIRPSGAATGAIVGSALAGAELLHPPGPIALGDVTTGYYASAATDVLSLLREAEEHEIGFVYETPEGLVGFQDRSHRAGLTTPAATFSDDPADALRYSRIEQLEHWSQIFNYIVAGVSPYVTGEEKVVSTDPGPYILDPGEQRDTETRAWPVLRYTGHIRRARAVPTPNPPAPTVTTDTSGGAGVDDGDPVVLTMPATVNEGDLLLAIGTSGLFRTGYNVNPATGWSKIYESESFYVFAKKADGTEDSTNVSFPAGKDTTRAWHIYRATGWSSQVALSAAIEVSSEVAGTSVSPNPPAISPSWGTDIPSIFLAVARNGSYAATAYPSGYSGGTTNGGSWRLHTAHKIATAASEDPGVFTISSSAPWVTLVLAIQGAEPGTEVGSSVPSGVNPKFTIEYLASVGGTAQAQEDIEVMGIPAVAGDQQSVVSQDIVSQQTFGRSRNRNPPTLFADEVAAMAYADEILSRQKDEHPIVSMTYIVNRGSAYHTQAMTRRVGDRIKIKASQTSETGLGINEDFFIEAISHNIDREALIHEVTYECSPASVTDP